MHITNKQKFLTLCLILPFYIFLGGYIVAYSIMFIFSVLNLNLTEQLYLMLVNLITPFITLCMLFFTYKEFLIDSWHKFEESFSKNMRWIFTGGIGIVYLGNIASNILMLSLNIVDKSDNQATIESLADNFPAYMIISAVILAPLVEEMVFRGFIYNWLKKYNVILSMIISSLLFGLLHVFDSILVNNDLSELIQMIPYAVMGFTICYSYKKFNNIFVPIGIHSLMNAIAMIAILSQK